MPERVDAGSPFLAQVRITTTAAVHIQTLRLRLEEFEHADFTDYSERTDDQGELWEQRASARFYEERCLEEFVLATDLKLEAEGCWEGAHELTVPATARPTYDGRWFRHSFKVEVVAVVPWGADLEEREVFTVVGPPEAPTGEVRSRESVFAEISVRPKREEEVDWTPLKPGWVTNECDGCRGPAFESSRCKHERLS